MRLAADHSGMQHEFLIGSWKPRLLRKQIKYLLMFFIGFLCRIYLWRNGILLKYVIYIIRVYLFNILLNNFPFLSINTTTSSLIQTQRNCLIIKKTIFGVDFLTFLSLSLSFSSSLFYLLFKKVLIWILLSLCCLFSMIAISYFCCCSLYSFNSL